ncbi:MAG: hypothetical protein ACLFNU_12690 [Bacteroidales bacterium]
MRKVLSIVIIPVIMLLFYNQVANWHFHKLPNGIVVEHAHPFTDSKTNDTPYQSHAHTEMEFLVIGLMSTTLGLVVFALLFSLVLSLTRREKLIPQYAFISHSLYLQKTNPLRGPPKCF